MADVKPSYRWPDAASECSKSQSSKSQSQPDELELLREETKRLRELVIALSKKAIKNAANTK
jgi:hypothetical protein